MDLSANRDTNLCGGVVFRYHRVSLPAYTAASLLPHTKHVCAKVWERAEFCVREEAVMRLFLKTFASKLSNIILRDMVITLWVCARSVMNCTGEHTISSLTTITSTHIYATIK